MALQSLARARTLPMPYKFSDGVLYDNARIEVLRGLVTQGSLTNHLRAKWDLIAALPDEYEVKGAFDPWVIPDNYSGESGTNLAMLAKLHSDTMTAAGYALRYLVLGDGDDAVRSARIIEAYSNISSFGTNNGSTLNWFDKVPILIQAAMMIESSGALSSTVSANFKQTLIRAFGALERIAYTRTNNWGAWALTMEFAASIFLQDRARFDSAVSRWRSLFDGSVVSGFLVQNPGPANGALKNNVPYSEIYRMGSAQGNGAYGLLYSAFHLDGLTIAAEYARLGGVWLFDHVAPDGSSLKGYWHEIARQKRFSAPEFTPDYLTVQWYNTSNQTPEGQPYRYTGYYTNRIGGGFHIANALWPDPHATDLIDGGFWTVPVPAGTFPPMPAGQAPYLNQGYPILQDYFGMYACDLLYYGRPLWG